MHAIPEMEGHHPGMGVVIDASTEEGKRELIQFTAQVKGLLELQEPFEHTESLPKPMWKGAWDNERKGKCDECGGYHCLVNTIHLDYVGHAEVTRRLLEVDPWWNWEPMSVDDDGLPRFDRFGGLWIYLTVCGVTRKGYGDAAGKQPGTTAVKEIIGDAIRNAAMRFGVALDLWSKLDRHEGKNPGATYGNDNWQTQGGNAAQRRGSNYGARGSAQAAVPADAQAAPPRRANQDALDALKSVCDEHGYSTQYCIDRFWSDYDIELKDAAAELILVFADTLVAEATAGPADDEQAGADGSSESASATGGDADVAEPTPAADGAAAGAPDAEAGDQAGDASTQAEGGGDTPAEQDGAGDTDGGIKF